ncbi:accessory Sec system protein Asp1 [Streptococcus pluranimalium]|uniref:Accessory Sec system protein Asp1 n=1 Tax=Streptococcus pluranimalium TaxID=82348 RepID=A0A345VMR8_9STRE|nr:accessory Sec system protein Asp1 [Streptococcus pluranimalium]AXJ14020.1 hypothetical protein Sp14A_21360 [Streptococcus pluranimalium]
MYYFIPAWYESDRLFYQEPPLWFRVFNRVSFDDTVNQLKMFQSSQASSTLIQLSYNPNFRYFLHKQDLLLTQVWSFFDDIQNINNIETKMIHFKSLNWPKGVQFIYTPFKVLVRKGAELFAEIQFAENGNLLRIEFKEKHQNLKHYIFDDRGFLSSILYFREDIPFYQDYLNTKGIWQVREWLQNKDRPIEINPRSDRVFLKSIYSSWDELIQERLNEFRQYHINHEQDVVVIASDSRHNDLLLEIFEMEKKVFSFYGDRYPIEDSSALDCLVSQAEFLVVDRKQTEQLLVSYLKTLGQLQTKISRITPFDTRLRLGRSQMVKELIIYFLIDDLSDSELNAYLESILDLMSHNPLIVLKVVTYNAQYNLKQLEDAIIGKIKSNFVIEDFMEVAPSEAENQLEEDEELILKSIFFEKYNNENQIIMTLDTARLVIDLSKEPDIYTQIASISAGVPQINRIETDYVSHLKNGWIIKDEADLKTAITYYFDGLTNWNKSLVYAVQKMGDYTSGKLLKQWEALLDN